MANVIGACGLVCSECPAYVATKANDAAAIEKTAAQWSKEYNADIKPEYVWCDGCMDAGPHKCGHCAECDIRTCAVERGYANCAPCADFGCEKVTKLFAMVPAAKTTLESLRGK